MQKFLRTLTLVAMLALPWVSQGQNAKVSEYDGEVTRAAYSSILSNGGTEVVMSEGTGTAQLQFDMPFGESNLSAGDVTIKANGSVELADGKVIAPLMLASGNYANGKVLAKSTPNELVVEWRKVVNGSSSYSFQMRLAKQQNGDVDVEFHYGPMTLNGTTNVVMGMKNGDQDIYRVGTVSNRYDTVVRQTSGWTTPRDLSSSYYYSSTHPAYSTATGQGVVYTFTQPACVKPAGVTVASPTYWDSLFISWNAYAGANKYEVYVTDATAEPTEATNGVIVTATTANVVMANGEITGYHIGGLHGSTPYYVYVRKYCGDVKSGWAKYNGSRTTPASCPAPTSTNFSLTSAGVASWTLTSFPNIETVDIYYSTENTAPTATTTPTIPGIAKATENVNLAARSDMQPATTYYVWMRGNCTVDGGTTTDWVSRGSFSTPCPVFLVSAANPFTENFNTLTSGIPDCWDNEQGTTTNASYRWNYYATGYSGAGLRFNSYSNSNGLTNILATPQLKLTVNSTLSFYYKNPNGGDFTIQISNDGGVTKTDLATGLTGVSSWTLKEIDLSAYTNDTVVIYFKGTSNYGYSDAYIYLDEVSLEKTPACDKVADLAISAEKVVSWTAGNATKWQIRYKKTTDENYAYRIVETTPSVTLPLTGAAGTLYEIAARSICSAGDTLKWSESISYTMPLSLPYSNDFEDGLNGITFYNGGTNAWARGTAKKKDGSYGLYISNDGGTTYAYSHGSMQTYAYVVLPFSAAGEYQFDFDWTSNGENNWDFLRVALIPDATALPTSYNRNSLPTGAINVGGGNLQSNTSWTHVSRVVSVTTPGNYKLAFIWCNDGSGGSQPPAAIDNISVIALTCPPPTNFAVNAETRVATWTASNNADHYQVWVGAATSTVDDIVEADAITMASGDEILNLNPSTTYMVWLRSWCSADDQSDWVGPVTFTTPATCKAPTNLMATPGTGDAANSVVLGWTEGTGVNNPTGNTGNWEILYKKSGSNDWISVTATSNPYTLNYLDMATTYQWKVRTICQAGDTSDFSGVSSFNTVSCVAFGEPGAEEIIPINGSGSTSTNSSLPLQSNWDYSVSQQIYTADEIGGAGIINSIAFEITGVKSRSVDVYLVETDKTSFSSASDWVALTESDKVFTGSIGEATGWKTLTFATSFNYSGNGSLVVTVINTNGSYSSGFSASVTSNNTSKALYKYRDNTPIVISDLPSGTVTSQRNIIKLGIQYLECLKGDCVPPTVAITTGPDGDNAKAELTFSGEETQFGYKYGAQGFDPSTATPHTVTGNTATITPLDPETTYDLYVYSVCEGVDNPRMVRYSFTTPFVPRCKPQTNFATSNVTYTGATVTWQQEDPTQEPESWMLRWSTEDFDPDNLGATYNTETIAGAATGSFTFSGLHNGDHVYMYTKATCNANDASVIWSSCHFQLPAIAAPTELTSWHTTNISDSLTWTEATEGITSWTVAYATADFDPTDPTAVYETYAATNDSVKFTGLTPAAKYYVYVRANSGDEHSAWSAQHTFKTLCPDGGELAIGEMTNENEYLPVYTLYDYSFTEQIYTAEDMGAATQINSISYYVSAVNDDDRDPVQIYISNTDKTVFESTTDWVSSINMTLVYDGPMVTSQTGWHTLDFDAPFAYDGTNLIIAVNNNDGGYQGTAKFGVIRANGNQALRIYRDNNPYDPTNPGLGTLLSVKNNFIFGTPCNTSVTCFAPVMRTSSIDSMNNVTLRWSARTDLEPMVNNYRVSYNDYEFDPTVAGAAETIEVTDADSLVLNGSLFAGDKDYYFAVQTACTNEGSRWIMTTIHTNPEVYVPTNVVATTPDNSSDKVALTWKDNNPAGFNVNSWDVAYGLPGFDPDTVSTLWPATATTATIEGLKHSTNYEFYVRAVKGTKVSEWSSVATGRTGCAPWKTDDLPLVENFDSYATSEVPNCWSRIGTNNSTSSTYTHSGNRSYSFNSTSDQYAILPELASSVDVSNLTLSLAAYFQNLSCSLTVGVMTNNEDATTFTEVATITPDAVSNWQNFEVSLADYAGEGRYVALKGKAYSASSRPYIDDVTLKVTEVTNTLADGGDNLAICGEYVMPDTTSGASYHGNLNATYIIRPSEAGKVVKLTGSYDLEQGYDFLRIYRGTTATEANLVATLTGSGNLGTGLMTGSINWADSGAFTLVLTTDDDNDWARMGFKFMVACECPVMAEPATIPVEHNAVYTWAAPRGNGKTYTNHYLRAARTGEQTDSTWSVAFTQKNVGGHCDSVVNTLELTLHPDFVINYGANSICERDTFHLNNDGLGFYGKFHTATGNYSDTLHTVHGADSVGVLALQMNEAPVAYIYYNNRNITAPVTDFCDNAPMGLVAQSNMASTFVWEDGTEGSNRTAYPHVLDTFTVVATDNAYQCTSLPVSIYVSTTPVAELSISATDTVICRGESTTLTLADANNVAATYRWSNGQTGTSITVRPDSTKTYTVTATTANDSRCQTSAEFTVAVNQLPEVTLTTSLSEVCRDSVVTLNATEVDGYTYLWSNNATTATTTVNPTATGLYSVAVTETATGCVNNFETSAITVYPSYTVNDTMEVCYTNNPFTWGAQTLTEDGDYTQNFKIAHGCDSLVNVNFAFKTMATINTRRELCEGTAYTWGGITRNANLDTTVHFVSTPLDCPVDSVLLLTVNHPASSSFDRTVCDSTRWNGVLYTLTGVHEQTLQTVKGCDSTVTMNLTVNMHTYAERTVDHACDSYEWNDLVYTQAGDYTQEFPGLDVNGCDSTETLHLLVVDNATTGDTTVTWCESRSFTWWATGETYYLTDVNGNISKTWANAAANGCDSTARLLLTMNYVSDTLNWVDVDVRDVFYLNTIDCYGNEVEKEFRHSRKIEERIPNAQVGHDQWYRAHLTVHTSVNHTDIVSACVPYEFGLVYYVDTTGEKHVVNKDNYVPDAKDSIILDNRFKVKGYYPVATLTKDTNISFNTEELGYDNGDETLIWRLRFTAKQPSVKTMEATTCYNVAWESPKHTSYSDFVAGEVNTIEWNRVDSAAANGCDSIYKVNLMVNPVYSETDTLTFCESQFTLNTTTNKYEYVKVNPNDSTQKVTLTIAGALNEMPSYGNTVTTDWTTALGCDSNVTYRYTVLPTVRETIMDTACREYVWDMNQKTYTQSGDYYDTTTSVRYGCDSIVTLSLTIFDTVKLYTFDTACITYEGPDGNTYRIDSTFVVLKGTSKWGCDTIEYKHYTVKGMQTTIHNVVANNAYTWNGVKYTESVSGVQFDATMPGECDSVVILNLTMMPALDDLCEQQLPYSTTYGVTIDTVGADQQYTNHVKVDNTIFDTIIDYTVKATRRTTATVDTVKCDTYTFKGTTYTANATINDTLTSVVTGCDSILTFNLVINKSTDSVHTQVACDNYIWAGKIFTESNTYVIDTNDAGEALKNAKGCDSTATLHLTINKNIPVRDTVAACYEYYWVVGNSITNDTLGRFTASGKYGFEVEDSNGCFTVDSLFLTINDTTYAKDTLVMNVASYTYNGVLFTAPFDSDTLHDDAMKNIFINTRHSETTGVCDSIVTTRLVLELGTIVNETMYSCGRYTWKNGITYEWIPLSERQQYGNPNFNYKDVTNNLYIQENPMYTTYTINPSTGDSVIDKTYVLWLNMSEAAIADKDTVFLLSRERLTIGDSTFNFSEYKAAKKNDTVNVEVHYGSTYYCDNIEYWTVHLNYNYDTAATTYLCYSDSLADGMNVDSVFMLNDTIGKGTAAEMVRTTPYIRMAQLVGVDTTVVACDSFTWHDSTYTVTPATAPTFAYQVTRHNVACDSVVTLNLTINKSVTGDTTVVACESFKWHGTTYTASTDSATYKVVNGAANGCDSTATLHLTINHATTGDTTVVACESFKWHDSTYTASTTSATYKVVNGAANGCDSTVTLHLTINHVTTGDTTAVACDSLVWHDSTYTASTDSAIFVMTNANVNGCDSIVTLHLTIHNTSELTHDTINYRGGSYRFEGHLYVAPTLGDSVDITRQNANGCDSIVRYHIWVQQYEIEYENVVACGLYTWTRNNHTYQYVAPEQRPAGAMYKDLTTGEFVYSAPFDTVDTRLHYLNLTLNEAAFGDTTVARFPLSQDSLVLGNDTFSFTAQKLAKQDTTVNVWFHAGSTGYYCDSLVYATINLVYNYNTVEENVCYATDTLEWNGHKFPMPTAPQTYTFTDTIDRGTPAEQVTTKKVYRRAFSGSTFTATACDSYDWMNADTLVTTITTAGVHDYTHTFVDQYGCDSVVTLTLTLNTNSSHRDAAITACDSAVWNGIKFYASATDTIFRYNTTAGCASVDTVNITINKNFGRNEVDTACDRYTWHGVEYIVSTKAYFDSVDDNECHHMDTLTLTINTTNHYDSVIWAGEGSYRYKGVMYTRDTNLFDTALVKTVNGCDSIYDVAIHVGSNFYATTDTIVCSEYTWINGVTYQWISPEESAENNNALYKTSTGSYIYYMPTYTKHNEGTFDSVFTLKLTLTQRYNGVDDTVFFVSNDSLVYGDSIFRFTEQNNRAANALGFSDSTFIKEVVFSKPIVKQYCDSVIMLNVTLKNNYIDSGDVHICVDQTSYTWRGHTINTSTNDFDHAHGPWHIYDTLTNGYIEYVTVYQHPYAYSTDRREACDSYVWRVKDGNEYVVVDTFYNSTSQPTYLAHDQYGCDSVISLLLTIKKNSNKDTNVIAHCGDYTWTTVDNHQFTFNKSIDTAYYYTAANGCPSRDSLHLEYHPVYNVTPDAIVACDKYVWEGAKMDGTDTTILTSGTYTHTFQSVNGCDSTVTLTVTINHNTSIATYDTTYFGDTYMWNGAAYTTADTFFYAYNAPLNGCPSVDTLYLHMEKGTKTTTGIECDSYQWHGTTYTVADLPADTDAATFYYMNKTDGGKNLSQDTLVLTLHQTTVNYESVAACKTYTWNGMTRTNTTNNVMLDTLAYVHTELSEAGCPIIDTLYLTLGTGRIFVYDEATSCGPYEWVVNGKVIDTLYESMQTMAEVATATGCDSVVNLTLTVYEQPHAYESASICDNYAMPYVWRGKSYDAAVEDDTVHTAFTAQCDSIIHFSLTINETKTTALTDQVCLGNGYNGYNFSIPAASLTESTEYTFVDSLHTVAGCDSVVTLTLTVGTVLTGDTSAVACDEFVWYGETYTTSGEYTYMTSTLSGCDSVVTMALTVNHSNSGVDVQTVCDSYTWELNGETYTASTNEPTVTLTNAAGCDSVVTLNLTITNSTVGDTTAAACSYFVWHGQAYAESGDYVYTTNNGNGCDSVITLHLTINQPTAGEETVVACVNYEWNGNVYTTSGDYPYNTTNVAGCDSTATLHLTINQPVATAVSETICGTEYTWNEVTYTESGVYTYTTEAANHCDSVVTLTLVLNEPVNATLTASACDSYEWNDRVYTQSGSYVRDITDVNGCAATETLVLTINESTASDTTATACDSYEWHGNVYATSGDYTFTTTNAANCDSVVTLHLTVNNSNSGSDQQTACVSYEWNGQLYTETGVYHANLTNVAGCDSTATLVLTINQPVRTTVSQTACDNYTWTNGNGQSYTESGNYTYTVTEGAANGCDSIVTLSLTINPSYLVTDTPASTCDGSYTWNGVTYTQSGTYYYYARTVDGCDSTAQITLTINQETEEDVYETACDSYTWENGDGVTYTESGTHTFIIEVDGCSNTTTLHLTINNSTTGSEDVEAIGDSYVWHDVTYHASGSYEYHTTNAAGCDSTVTLNLTLTPAATTYIVTVVSGDETMGTVDPAGTFVVEEGERFTATATANEGYRFVRWNNGETTATINITVTENVTLVAIFTPVVGIDENEAAEVTIFSTDNKIVVRGVQNDNVYVYDVNGRVVYNKANVTDEVEFTMHNTGAYLVKVGNAPAKRVVVIR